MWFITNQPGSNVSPEVPSIDETIAKLFEGQKTNDDLDGFDGSCFRCGFVGGWAVEPKHNGWLIFLGTAPKINSPPLKNGAWKTILSCWVLVTFQGRAVKLGGVYLYGDVVEFVFFRLILVEFLLVHGSDVVERFCLQKCHWRYSVDSFEWFIAFVSIISGKPIKHWSLRFAANLGKPIANQFDS